MKVPSVSVLAKTQRYSFFVWVVLSAACAGLVAPTPLRAASQARAGAAAKEKTLKEILDKLHLEQNPPKVVADPNANRNLGYMFRWGLPEYEVNQGQSLTLAPQQSLDGRTNPFDSSKAFGGVDPFNRESRFSPPGALDRSNPLGQSRALERENPFKGFRKLNSGLRFGNTSPFGDSQPLPNSETFGARSQFGVGGRYGGARQSSSGKTFGTSRPFGKSRRFRSSFRFGEATPISRFNGFSGAGPSSRLNRNPGVVGKGISKRSSAFNRPSPFDSTGASDGGSSRSGPTIFDGR